MKKIVRFLPLILVLAAIIFFPHPLAPGRIAAYHWRFHRTLKRIRQADPQEILAACRSMLANREQYQKMATASIDGGTWLDFPLAGDTITPVAIRVLGPTGVEMDEDSVLLVFFGGFNHLALRGYALNAQISESQGDTELCKGLWLIDD